MEEGTVKAMVTKKNYDALGVKAAHSVMLELTRLLGEYHDDVVVVGGWVPAMLIPQASVPHVGSLDVDLALNHKTLQDPGYDTIIIQDGRRRYLKIFFQLRLQIF